MSRRLDCLLKPFVHVQIKENIKAPRLWPVIDGFPSQRASNVEIVSIWWRYNGVSFTVPTVEVCSR